MAVGVYRSDGRNGEMTTTNDDNNNSFANGKKEVL